MKLYFNKIYDNLNLKLWLKRLKYFKIKIKIYYLKW